MTVAATRWVIGPSSDYTVPEGGGGGKKDVQVTFAGIDGDTASFTIPAYDLNTYNRLCELRVYLVPSGTAPPADGPAFLASSLPYSTVDTSSVQAGGNAQIPLPKAAPGKYAAMSLLGFDV